MLTEELTKKLTELEGKIDAVYVSTEKTRKYFLYTFVVTLALFVLPLVGLIFAIPSLIGTYSQISNIGTGGF